MAKYLKTPISPEDEIKILKSEIENLKCVTSCFLKDYNSLDSMYSVLLEAMQKLADEKHWRDSSIIYGAFTAIRMVAIAQKALEEVGK